MLYGLKYIALRYFNAAGADESSLIGESHNPESHLIPIVLQAIQGKRDNIKVFGNDYDTPDGTCLRDYIHVNDLANAHRLSVEKLDEFQGFINLGTGIPTSVMEIIQPSAITIVPSVADIFLTLPETSTIAPPLLCSSGTKYLMRTSGCSWI